MAATIEMNAMKRVAVVGAGLGGLTVAGFLQRAGFPVTVYEQAPSFSRIGAGIILSANAMKAFRRLGIERSPLSGPINEIHRGSIDRLLRL
jgi:6-hydroxynicotinate 3-monooxygenase